MLERVHELEVAIVALMAELVARKTKDGQLIAVFVRQGIQLNEVPDSRASHGGDVVNEHNLTLELSEVVLGSLSRSGSGAAAKGLALEVMEGCHGTNGGAL